MGYDMGGDAGRNAEHDMGNPFAPVYQSGGLIRS
jgi:hypothetical protein